MRFQSSNDLLNFINAHPAIAYALCGLAVLAIVQALIYAIAPERGR